MKLWQPTLIEKTQYSLSIKFTYKFKSKHIIPNVLLKLNEINLFACGTTSSICIFYISSKNRIELLNLYESNSDIITMTLTSKTNSICANAVFRVLLWKYETINNKSENNVVFTDKGGHDGIVRAVLCLENGNVVSGGDDKKIIIWNENKDRLVRMDELIGHNGPVVSLYQLKEKNLISGDMYSVIYIWDGFLYIYFF
jgi:WD40 repeat protein